jgi:hypothetical protein
VGSQSNVEGDSNEGSCTHSYNFGPSTITVGRIQEMIKLGYFAEGGARALREETILELENNEPVVL